VALLPQKVTRWTVNQVPQVLKADRKLVKKGLLFTEPQLPALDAAATLHLNPTYRRLDRIVHQQSGPAKC
jgi:hypothetical protein